MLPIGARIATYLAATAHGKLIGPPIDILDAIWVAALVTMISGQRWSLYLGPMYLALFAIVFLGLAQVGKAVEQMEVILAAPLFASVLGGDIVAATWASWRLWSTRKHAAP
jgi:hypothetical protein